MGIGHVRYPTSGENSICEVQPFYVNSPFGITLAHNGNLVNTNSLRKQLFETQRRHMNTASDSEVLLNIFASELDQFQHYPIKSENIFSAITKTHQRIKGAYSCVGMIIGHGLFAFRDPNGIRPLVIGERKTNYNKTEYIIASESVALDILGFKHLRDVAPGEDDSIVRGNTSRQIVEMARDAGATSVYLASAAPEIRFPNLYGIDIPNSSELIAHQKSLNEIRTAIGADALIFQNLRDLENKLKQYNPRIKNFESSIFNGIYPTQ
uniref:Glutamine amidotransferase type-2 domain-containing protein n=1 Tax=Glossina pallidipes TaxID=7398 RepID=A0A1A9Z1G4_GLOPL